MTALAQKVLLEAPRDPAPVVAEVVVAVAREHGVHPFRQLREMTQLRLGEGKLAGNEYYASGAFRPDIPMAQKRTYVGIDGSYRINVRANISPIRAFLADKVMYSALLNQLGIPTTVTQAVAHPVRRFGKLRTMRNPDEVMGFLKNEAMFPVFAKPIEGSASVGSVLLKSIKGDVLTLGTGREADAANFAQEIFEDYPEGFLFQNAIVQHDDMVAMTGHTTGTVRVVTTRDAEGIRPLYSVWKVPSPRAMSDNFWQAGSMVALLDDETGKVTQCNYGTGLSAEWITHHPVSGLPFEGHQIANWDKIQETVCDAHGLFPEVGILGWDVGVGPDGPIIVECNDNPFHVLWQLAAGKGIRTPEFAERFEAARAETLRIRNGMIDVQKKRKKAKRGKA